MAQNAHTKNSGWYLNKQCMKSFKTDFWQNNYEISSMNALYE